MKKLLTIILFLPLTLLSQTFEDEYLILASLVEAEADGEPVEGKELVAYVAIQRAIIKKTTLKEQIMRCYTDKKGKAHYQFDGITTHRFSREPSQENKDIALKVIRNFKDYPKGLYYFVNTKIATHESFIKKITPFKYKVVGNHTFYYRNKNYL